MSTLKYGQIGTIDPHDVDTRGVDFTDALATGDSVSSCAVSIVSGTCQLASSQAGSYSTTATASVASNIATVWIKSCTAPEVVLLFRATTAAGRTLDATATLRVVSR